MSDSIADLETVNLTIDGASATVELNRPQVLNAWNKQFALDLSAALVRCDEDEQIRAVRIRGAGRAFSSGADLKDMGGEDLTPDGRPDVYKVLTERYHPIMRAIRKMPKPVVAQVGGGAIGIGCSLALCCDLIVAGESSYFLLAFVNIGLAPDGGSSLFVPTRVGMARASEMAMLGERIPAPQALQWGLVNRVVPDEQLDAEAAALTARLAEGPTRAYGACKQQLNNHLYARMDEQLELEAKLQREMAGSDDLLEGVSAFLQKRPPTFKGR
jgi:2-(1,2-epoxy-1,2-dihydrophenyl)acetyl-CoA isomerase